MPTPTLPTLVVEIVSDIVCPWCFIGLRRFEKAAASLANRAVVEARFAPYRISPDVPAGGVPYREHLLGKFKSEKRIEEIWERVRGVGLQDGIAFAFDRQRTMPDTLPGHRLIRFAQETADAKTTHRLVEALFVAHFCDARDTGDATVLADLAEAAGLPREAAGAMLASDAYADDVYAEVKSWEMMGVTGVPAFVVERERGVSGAQPVETLVAFFEECLAARG